jgi:hypothetical protein
VRGAAESGTTREPFKQLQDNAANQQQVSTARRQQSRVGVPCAVWPPRHSMHCGPCWLRALQGHAAGEALPPGKRTSAAGRSVGKKQAAPAAAAAAAAVTKTPAHEQPAAADNGGKPNIVTSWGGGGGRAVSAGCKPGVTPAAAAEAGAPGESTPKEAGVSHLEWGAQGVCGCVWSCRWCYCCPSQAPHGRWASLPACAA